MLQKVLDVTASIERMLDLPIMTVKRDRPVVHLARIALIRELMWADQVSAALRDGTDYEDEFGKMEFNSRIVESCCDGLIEETN